MESELVIGIDSSTTATKAIAWDRDGEEVAGAMSPLNLFSPEPNFYEQDPEEWWDSLVEVLNQIVQSVGKDRIRAIAIANQRETFAAIGKSDKPVRPAIIWLDERCKSQVDKFSALTGPERIHEITGKPKDYAPVVYRLSWMKENEPGLFAQVKMFCDVQAYLVYRLTGKFRTGRASADPMGYFDMKGDKWSDEIIKHLGIIPGQLPEVFPGGAVLGAITGKVAKITGLTEGTLVISGGGDGQAAGLGVNALKGIRAYLNLGTAVVSGCYAGDYIFSESFRTLSTCTEKGYYCETSLRSGTFLIDWLLDKVLGVAPSEKNNMLRRLESEARQIKAGSDGLMVLPYWNAVMNPYWDPSARGCIIGFTSGHKRGHLFRAILEGIAMEQTIATRRVERVTATEIHEYAVIGGGSKSDLWKQIFADVSGKKILSMSTGEASSLGAGIAAAVGTGWYKSFEEAARRMVKVKETITPVTENEHIYRKQIKRFAKIYKAVKNI